MSPQLSCGDYVVLLTAFYKGSGRFVHPDQRLIFEHPQYGRMVKDVVSVDIAQHTFTATGLNEHSISSRQIGDIPFESIIGRVLCAIKRPLGSNQHTQ